MKTRELLAAIDEAQASLGRGEGRIITRESMRELAELPDGGPRPYSADLRLEPPPSIVMIAPVV